MPAAGQGGPVFAGSRLDVGTANIGELNVATSSIGGNSLAIPRNAFVPPGGFRSWTAVLAKARAGTGIATAMAFGASIAAGGTQVTDILTKSYWALWRQTKINAGYAIHGDSFLPTNSAAWNSGVVASVFPFVMDVTPLAWGFYGPFICPVWATATTMPLMHATHPSTALGYNARSARFYYFDLGNQDGGVSAVGRTAHVDIDGAGDQTITALGDNLIHYKEFTNLSNAANHVLNFGNQGAANIATAPIAVAWYPSTSVPTTGVHYAWFAVNGGYTVADLIRTDGQYPQYRPERLIGPSNAAVPFTPSAALSPPFAPDLVFFDIFDDISWVNRTGAFGSTPNTTVSGLNPAAYLHGLRRITQALRAKPTGCDIVHHMPNLPAGLVSDTTPLATYQLQHSWHYYATTFQLAQLNGHGLLNTDAEWGELAQTNGYMPSGTDIDPHPTNAGMLDIANRIASRLGL
jgi:hypothetical protein